MFQLAFAFWGDCQISAARTFPMFLQDVSLLESLRQKEYADSKLWAGDIVLPANSRNTLSQPISLGMRLQQGNDEERLRTRLAVIFTCRKIYLEVAPIYYGENTFFSYGLCHRAIEGFAGAVGRDNATAITAISLYDDWFPGDKYLSMLPGLKRLYIRRPGPAEALGRMVKSARDHASLIVICDGVILNPKSAEEWAGLRSSV